MPLEQNKCAVCMMDVEGYALGHVLYFGGIYYHRACADHKGMKFADVIQVDNEVEKGLRYNNNKPKMGLLPLLATQEIAKVLTYGAIKYAPFNWTKGLSWTETLDSALRHLTLWQLGETNDRESGLKHLAHAGCNILFLITYELFPGLYGRFDDRWKPVEKYPADAICPWCSRSIVFELDEYVNNTIGVYWHDKCRSLEVELKKEEHSD